MGLVDDALAIGKHAGVRSSVLSGGCGDSFLRGAQGPMHHFLTQILKLLCTVS